VDILDAADVVYGVDPNAPPQGLTSDVPNVMALIMTSVDTLEGLSSSKSKPLDSCLA